MKFLYSLIFLLTVPVLAQSYPVTDTLIGSGAIGSPWTQSTASRTTSTCSKSSTGLSITTAFDKCAIFYTGAIFSADQYAQVTMTSTYLNYAGETGPCVRCTAAGSGYIWESAPGSNFVATFVNGTYMSTVITSPPIVSMGDTIRLSVSGSTVTATNVTTSMSATGTDTNLAAGSPGLWDDQSQFGGTTSTTPTNFQADCYPSTCGVLAAPTLSPNPGSYSASVPVTLTGPTGATVCYTTDGTIPTATTLGTCSHGTTYSTPFVLTSTSTVEALSTQSGQPNSSVMSGIYTITSSLYPVTDTLIGSGVIGSPWTQATGSAFSSTCSKSSSGLVTTTQYDACGIVYTGATFASDQYAQVTMTSTYLGYSANTGPCVRCTSSGDGYVWISGSNNFVAVYSGGNYVSTALHSTPTVSLGDTIKLSISGSTITATNITTGASVSGTDTSRTAGNPGVWDDQGGAGLPNTSTTPTNFQADCYPSTCGALAVPTFSPTPGAYPSNATITLAGPSGATICYTTDGTAPAASTPGTCSHGSTYSSAFTITTTTTVQALSTQAGQSTSSVASAVYAITFPTTHYIRTDGGTSAQCDGIHNAPVAGASSNQCALSHPYYLVTDNTTSNPFSWSFVNGFGVGVNPGDTIKFEDQGPYYIGQQNGSLGTSWLHCVGDATDCVLPPLPNRISFLGYNSGSCHATSHTGLVNPTQFVGINSVYWMFSLQGTVSSDFECFEFTQPDMCTLSGRGVVSTSINCSQGTNNYAMHGLMLNAFASGSTFSPGPANSTIRDYSAHGLANEGISGSKLNSLSTDVMTFSDIYLAGNANTGWDSDAGGCNTSCESVGTINVSHLAAVWSGCMEVKPNGGTIGGNGYTNCVDQAYNGNGDNVVMIATAGTWNWSDIITKWGAQDGFDGLHMGDDPAAQVTVNLTRAWSEGNEGQQIKVGGNFTVTNSVAISNCRRFTYAFPPNPSNYNQYVGLMCRANDGNAFQLSPGRTMTLENNTFVGYGNPILDLTCNEGSIDPVSGANFYCPAGSLSVVLRNNIFLGYTDPVTGTDPGGLYWGTATDPFANSAPTWNGVSLTPSAVDHNLWAGNIRASSGGGICPQDTAYESNSVCSSPLLVNQSLINSTTMDGVNADITASSPAISAGATISGLTTDYVGATRHSPPTIGAYENPPSAPMTDSLIGSGVIGLPWSQVTGTPFTSTCSYSSLGLVPTTSYDRCGVVYTGTTFSANQYAQVTMTSTYLNYSAETGPVCRGNTSGDGYVWLSGSNNFVARFSGGVYAETVVHSTPAVNLGDTIRLVCSGSTVTAINMTTGISASDTNTVLTSGNPGVWDDQGGAGLPNTSTTPTNFQGDCYPSSCGVSGP